MLKKSSTEKQQRKVPGNKVLISCSAISLPPVSPDHYPELKGEKANLLHIYINKLKQNLPNYPIEPVSALNPAPFSSLAACQAQQAGIHKLHANDNILSFQVWYNCQKQFTDSLFLWSYFRGSVKGQ